MNDTADNTQDDIEKEAGGMQEQQEPMEEPTNAQAQETPQQQHPSQPPEQLVETTAAMGQPSAQSPAQSPPQLSEPSSTMDMRDLPLPLPPYVMQGGPLPQPKETLRPSNRSFASRYGVLIGLGVSNAFALTVMLATYWLMPRDSDTAWVFIGSDFVLIPLVMGGVCAYFWQHARLSVPAYIGYGLLNSVIALLLAFAFLKEGMICLLMASPLLFVFTGIGCLIGRLIFKAQHGRLNATLIPLALSLFIADSLMPHHFENNESDRIVIHASPARVWQYIIDYPVNDTPSDYWLSHLGLPAPTQSTATGHYVGATRRCLFTGGIAFDEKITAVEPGRKLEFDVVTQPNHPEVVGHLVLQKGQFLLTDNHDGTTTVTGTSWYQLNVYPVCYYDLWTQDVVRHVHLRVMQHIKMLAERQGK